jgi:hypothetical protein
LAVAIRGDGRIYCRPHFFHPGASLASILSLESVRFTLPPPVMPPPSLALLVARNRAAGNRGRVNALPKKPRPPFAEEFPWFHLLILPNATDDNERFLLRNSSSPARLEQETQRCSRPANSIDL